MASAIVPKIYDPRLADQNLEIETEDAYAMARNSRETRDCWSVSPPPLPSSADLRSP